MKTAKIHKGYFTDKMVVFNEINGDSEMRSSQWFSGAYCEMMEVADSIGHFVSDIIEKASNGAYISEKQAWCVAFFALNNGFVKS